MKSLTDPRPDPQPTPHTPAQRTGLTTTTTQPANRPSHPADRGKPGDARHKGKRPHTTTSQGRQGRHAGQVARRMGQRTRDSNAIRYIEGMARLASPSQHSSGSPPHAPTSPTLASHAAQPSALAPHAPGSASVALGRTASKATRARWDQGSQGFEGAGTHTHSHTHPHTHTRKRFSHGRGV